MVLDVFAALDGFGDDADIVVEELKRKMESLEDKYG